MNEERKGRQRKVELSTLRSWMVVRASLFFLLFDCSGLHYFKATHVTAADMSNITAAMLEKES